VIATVTTSWTIGVEIYTVDALADMASVPNEAV
jgi:hypothetical protein